MDLVDACDHQVCRGNRGPPPCLQQLALALFISCNRERRQQSFESSSDHSMRQDVDEYKRRRGIVQFFLSADSMVNEPARGEVRKSWSR